MIYVSTATQIGYANPLVWRATTVSGDIYVTYLNETTESGITARLTVTCSGWNDDATIYDEYITPDSLMQYREVVRYTEDLISWPEICLEDMPF